MAGLGQDWNFLVSRNQKHSQPGSMVYKYRTANEVSIAHASWW
jgi:hypothetical protein